MKILSICKNGREVASTKVESPSMLIGRSPSCDFVLRAKGIKPVHFLVEWTGVGTMESGDGVWSVFDVSATGVKFEGAMHDSGVGEGAVISDIPTLLGGYEFKWRKDRLAETSIDGGSLGGGFFEKIKSVAEDVYLYQLEVVCARSDSQLLTTVYHLNPSGGEAPVSVPHLPAVKLKWGAGESGMPLFMDVRGIAGAKVFHRGIPFTAAAGQDPQTVKLEPGGVVQIDWNMRTHYFRLVPKIRLPKAVPQFISDRVLHVTLIALALTFMYFAYPRKPVVAEESAKEPPRIARIEVKELPTPVPAVTQPSAPTPPPMVATPPPEKQAEAAKTKAADMDKSAKPAKLPKASTAVANRATMKAVATANQRAAHKASATNKDVSSVGLLGALKAESPRAAKANAILTDQVAAKTVSGSDGGFVVSQQPTATVVRGNPKGSSLAAAYTNLKVTDSVTPVNQPVVSGARPGSATANYSARPDRMGGYSIVDEGDRDEFSAKGGLTKEQIRVALAAYRKDIRTCYERALVPQPKIHGRVVFKWLITPAGPVSWIKLQSATVDSPTLAPCVQGVINGIVFPQAPNGQPTMVIYPFEFQTKG